MNHIDKKSSYFWLLLLGGFFLTLYLLKEMLLPFVLAMGVAYLWDPLVDRLERNHCPRWLAAFLVLFTFLLLLFLFLLLLLPVLHAQFMALLTALPGYSESLKQNFFPKLEKLVQRLSPDDAAKLREAASNYAGTLASWLFDAMKGMLSGGLAMVNLLSTLFITPILAFYMMRDWDRMLARIDSWLPRRHHVILRSLASQINDTLSGFVRGQVAVCLILGGYYTMMLAILGVNYSIIIGLVAGFLSFVPYVGTVVGFAAGVGVAYVQFDDPYRVWLVVGVFVIGHLLEGNVITPKIIGDKIGLHPVWMMFALFAGGTLFGFVGVLLAVPVAAIIGVLVRFFLMKYLQSPLYASTISEENAG
ncbi:MAG: AI-2E family transporter [Alphaproteobacteria bacterium]